MLFTQAALRLLAAALEDSAVARALMLSDTSLPLLPPPALWAQTMAEQLSRIDACNIPQGWDMHRCTR